MESRILHVDMDAFFAAVEQSVNPRLIGKPVVVGGAPGGRGIVTTASYECRPYGVHSGMSAALARRRCPQAIFVPVNGWHYAYISRQLRDIYSEFSPRVEAVSVDEAFLDVTGMNRLFGSETGLGEKLKARIHDEFHLTCSLGIAPNKLLAKLASSVFKPDGLTVVGREDISRMFDHLPVEAVSGVGPATLKNLHRFDIRTIGDLVNCEEARIERCLGDHGIHLQRCLRGESQSTVVSYDDQPDHRSIGHETTFAADIGDATTWIAILNQLSRRVARRMRRYGQAGRTVTVKYRFTNFTTRTCRTTLPAQTDDSHVIFTAARRLLEEALTEPAQLRLLGVSVSGLNPAEAGVQEHLFGPGGLTRRKCTDRVVDALQDRFGDHVITTALARQYTARY
ncbi:MAG: DNA polymerase IV [Candidatus Zixiibacteriota bacterium]